MVDARARSVTVGPERRAVTLALYRNLLCAGVDRQCVAPWNGQKEGLGGGARMAERPMGNVVARSRRVGKDAGETDALSVVLGIAEDEPPPPHRIEAQILELLADAGKPVPVDKIARELHVDFLSLSPRLLELRRRGTILLEGSPGSELATLATDVR